MALVAACSTASKPASSAQDAASFLGSWSCQETTTLTNTCTGSCTSNDGGPQTTTEATVWTITAGANGEIVIAMPFPANIGNGGCLYNATVLSGSQATLQAGQTCVTPPINGSDGHTATYTSTLSSGALSVSGDTMTFAISASLVGNDGPPSGPTVGDTSMGTCTAVDAGAASSNDAAIDGP